MSEESGGGAVESSAPAEASVASTTAPVSANAPSAEAITDALESGEITEKEAKSLIKKFDLKIKGQTVSREYDLGDENFLKNQFQLAEVAKMEMQNSAELKKAYAKEMERFKSKPWEVLKELGFDPDELAQSRIEQRIEEMKKSPEQIRDEQREQELIEARKEAKLLREEKDTLEMQKLQEQAAVQINEEIADAIASHKSLPNSKYVQKRVADSMLWAMNNGYEDVTASDVLPLVEQEMRAEMGQLYDEMPEELLEQFIGKKNIERMRKKRVAQVKVPSLSDIKPTALSNKASEQSRKQEVKKPVASKDFFKNLGRNK